MAREEVKGNDGRGEAEEVLPEKRGKTAEPRAARVQQVPQNSQDHV